MPTIANNAEGFTSSPTTPTTGNTGGGSGTACSTVTQGTASTIRATTGSALFGSYGYEFNLVANGSDGACRLMWAFSEAGRLVLSTYWEVNAAITATEDVMGVRHSSGNMGVLLVGSDGKLIMQHAGGSTIAASKATNALATGTRYRIEMSVAKGTTTSNGTLGFAYFLGDSATAEFSWESAAQNAGTANAATVWIGRSTGRTQAHVTKYDEMRAATTASGWLAPVAVNATATAPAMAATAEMLPPTLWIEVEVSGAGPMTATALMLPPTVTATRNATVASPAATATAAMLTPTATATRQATVTATPASATGAMLTATVTATRSATVTATPATGTALMLTPTVSAGTNATVTAPAATATGAMGTPAADATRNPTVTAPAATATGNMGTPTIEATRSATITVLPMLALATMLTPGITATRNATIEPTPMVGAGLMLAPTITTAASVDLTIMATIATRPWSGTIGIIGETGIVPASDHTSAINAPRWAGRIEQ
ncbi:MAG: hypothetical protein KA973_14230 [Candidatus Microthrix sp.]|nr:hypothetical protein [Candidatus Microthrix sp.]